MCTSLLLKTLGTIAFLVEVPFALTLEILKETRILPIKIDNLLK